MDNNYKIKIYLINAVAVYFNSYSKNGYAGDSVLTKVIHLARPLIIV